MNVPILPITGKVPSNRLQRNKRTSRNVATAEPSTLHPCFTIQRPPSPSTHPPSKHPPSSEFFSKFFLWNLYRIFFEKIFSSYKKEHTPSNEIFQKKILPLQKERHILSIKKIFWWCSVTTLFLLQCNTESEEKSSFQPLPLIVFEAHVLFHKTGERYALFEAHPFSLSYFLFALERIRHFSFYIGGNVVLVKGFLEGWTFGGLKENMDICAWIEMWFSLSWAFDYDTTLWRHF